MSGSIERKSEIDRDKYDVQKAQVTVSKPIAIQYPHSPGLKVRSSSLSLFLQGDHKRRTLNKRLLRS